MNLGFFKSCIVGIFLGLVITIGILRALGFESSAEFNEFIMSHFKQDDGPQYDTTTPRVKKTIDRSTGCQYYEFEGYESLISIPVIDKATHTHIGCGD